MKRNGSDVFSRLMGKSKRTVHAPSSGGGMSSGAVLSVTLNDDEDVVWHWTHRQDGRSVVTGYTIVKSAIKSHR
jgi:hypothetical protein